MLSAVFSKCYAECHYAEFHSAGCHYAECHCAMCQEVESKIINVRLSDVFLNSFSIGLKETTT